MIILFGTKTRLKNYGAAEKIVCEHCHNEDYWQLKMRRLWFTLFFVPIFPIGANDRFLQCPICGSHIGLTKDEFDGYIETIESVDNSNGN